jgi:hypothetical protein
MAPTPFLNALGGSNVSVSDSLFRVSYWNPALVAKPNLLTVSFVNYYADIKYGYVGYSFVFPKSVGRGETGIKYLNYGQFILADQFGNRLGTFSGNEVELYGNVARRFGPFGYGMQLKLIYSQIESYSSYGIGVSMGGSWQSANGNTSIGVTLNNLGYVVKTYVANHYSRSLPFQIQAGITQKVPHTPFRVSMTWHHLNIPRLFHPEDDRSVLFYDFSGRPLNERNPLTENIFRHLILGLEIIPFPDLQFRIGYNHQRRQELKAPEQVFGTTGFAFGGSIRVKTMRLEYTYANFHVVGGVHHFGLITDISQYRKTAK